MPGCGSGCPVILTSENPGDQKTAHLVDALATAGSHEVTAQDECCAYCMGITLDVTQPPVSARRMKRKGKASPLSIVAYRAAVERKKGKTVEVSPQANRAPLLIVNGDVVDPLEDYIDADCGCTP